jgi:hypothetical protein
MPMTNFFCSIGYGLGSGSDFFGFDQLAGSSNYDASYTFNPADHGNLGSYPLYHTSYEVFSMMKKFVDPEFYVRYSFFKSPSFFALFYDSRHIEVRRN